MIDEKIVKLNETTLVAGLRYNNQVKISGFILQEPKYTLNENTGRESVSFIIWQVGKTNLDQNYAKSYNLIAYGKDLIKKIKEEVKSVCYVVCLASLQWQPKMKTYYPQLTEIEITHHIMDMELDPPYQK